MARKTFQSMMDICIASLHCIKLDYQNDAETMERLKAVELTLNTALQEINSLPEV